MIPTDLLVAIEQLNSVHIDQLSDMFRDLVLYFCVFIFYILHFGSSGYIVSSDTTIRSNKNKRTIRLIASGNCTSSHKPYTYT